MAMHLLPESLYSCIGIIDRFLSCECVPIKQLQLLAVASLLIASKYEETRRIDASDFRQICGDTFTNKEVLTMELRVVDALDYRLTVPTGYNFLQRFLHITKATALAAHLASYYMERIQLEYSSFELRPSHLAAAAVSLALNNPGLPENRIKVRSTYNILHQIVPTVPGVVRNSKVSRSPIHYAILLTVLPFSSPVPYSSIQDFRWTRS